MWLVIKKNTIYQYIKNTNIVFLVLNFFLGIYSKVSALFNLAYFVPSTVTFNVSPLDTWELRKVFWSIV